MTTAEAPPQIPADTTGQRAERELRDSGLPRVLVLTNMWPTDEHPHYGTWVESHARAVARLGIPVHVHFVNGHKSRWAYLRSALRVLRLNFDPGRFDLIHAQSGYSGALALLQRRTPVLTSFMGACDLLREPGIDGHVSLKSRVEVTVSRLLARGSNATITMTSEMERALPSSVRARNSVVPHGIDRSLFRPLPQALAREKLGWEPARPVVLFVGHTENKRLDLALAAVDLARAEFPDLELKVCTHVPQREVPLWMNAADVLVVTSNVEGSPNMVKEAMACDLPIVSVDVGDVRQVITGTRHCHLVGREPEEIAAGLRDVLRHAPVRSDGRMRSEHLALPAVAERLTRIYRKTAGHRLTKILAEHDEAEI